MLLFEENWKVLEEEMWVKIKDPFFWSQPEEWRSLACVGFPRYILFKSGELYRINDEGMGEELVKPRYYSHQWTYVLKRRLPKLDGTFYAHSERVLAHHLVAMMFLEKPAGAKQVGFVDGNKNKYHLDNIFWK